MPKRRQIRGDLPDTHEELSDFLQRLDKESDRAAVIVGAAYLDTALERVIANFMIDDPKAVEQLFEPGGRFADFSTKIVVAYCLGLIDPLECADLRAVLQMRNEFAHAFADLSLDQPTFAYRCANFHQLALCVFTVPDPTARDRLIGTVTSLGISLRYRAKSTYHRPQMEPRTIAEELP